MRVTVRYKYRIYSGLSLKRQCVLDINYPTEDILSLISISRKSINVKSLLFISTSSLDHIPSVIGVLSLQPVMRTRAHYDAFSGDFHQCVTSSMNMNKRQGSRERDTNCD